MTKILPLSDIVIIRKLYSDLDLKVVFTNGCFDILHIGHTRYLQKARELGDKLIVGINSDRSVREIKGSTRPVIPEAERAEVLAALECVSLVFIYDDLTPFYVIKEIVPDILVKGADWAVNDIIGKDVVEAAGGEVVTIPFIDGHSSSMIIKKVMYPLITLDAKISINKRGGVMAINERLRWKWEENIKEQEAKTEMRCVSLITSGGILCRYWGGDNPSEAQDIANLPELKSQLSTLKAQLAEREETLRIRYSQQMADNLRDLRGANAALTKRIEELVEGLRKLEWSSEEWSEGQQIIFHDCPVCGNTKEIDGKHGKDCWLNKLIGGKE
jgi:D-glycero-beta-D-manno-heptose 1-phosphate adenylyltransferase